MAIYLSLVRDCENKACRDASQSEMIFLTSERLDQWSQLTYIDAFSSLWMCRRACKPKILVGGGRINCSSPLKFGQLFSVADPYQVPLDYLYGRKKLSAEPKEDGSLVPRVSQC